MRYWSASIVKPLTRDSNDSASVSESRAVGSSGPKYRDVRSGMHDFDMRSCRNGFSKMHPAFLWGDGQAKDTYRERGREGRVGNKPWPRREL